MSEERALADRLSSYADAVAAFSLVNTLGFFAAIAEADTRCQLQDNRALVVSIMFVVQLMYVGAVAGLRRMELRLRRGLDSSETVERFRARWHLGRIAFTSFTAFGMAFFAALVLSSDTCMELMNR